MTTWAAESGFRDQVHLTLAGLTRQQCPWTLAPLAAWDGRAERRAAIWLARRVARPLMRLQDSDYRAHSLQARPNPRT